MVPHISRFRTVLKVLLPNNFDFYLLQMLVNVITSVIFVIMFGYFFAAAMLDQKFYWPFLVLFILPAIRIFLIGHWGQVLEIQVGGLQNLYLVRSNNCLFMTKILLSSFCKMCASPW
jgi:hypothetical protein